MSPLRPFVLAAAFACAGIPVLAQGVAGPYLAGRVAETDRNFAEAASRYSEAMMVDKSNPQIMQGLVGANIALGEIDMVAPLAQDMVDQGIGSQLAHMALIAKAAHDSDWATVQTMIDEGRGIGPLVDGLSRAWALVGKGDMAGALTEFDAVAKQDGLNSFGLYHKALALALVGDLEGSQAIFAGDTTGRLQITRRGAMANIEVLSQLDRNAEAIAMIDATFGPELDPALRQMKAQMQEGVRLPFTHVRNATDGLAEVFFAVASALEGEAAPDYTLLYSRIAQYLRPDHVDATLLSADLLDVMGRYDLAEETYRQVPETDPAFHAAELGRADALRSAGKTDAAIEVLQALSKSHADLPIVHLTLGDFYRAEQKYAEAVKAYDQAISLYTNPDDARWFAFYTRGIAYERLGQWDKAEVDFRHALELSPGQPQVLNYLGYSLVEMDENLDEALGMIEQAVATSPDSGHIVDSLGWALFRLGRYEEAAVQLERAAELMPVDPIVNDHLGDGYWAVGRKTEARFQWHRALSFGPEEEDATRIRRKLEVGLDQVLADEGADPIKVADGK
ncbi:tetratricopeptide repeat protein [Donghicola sp. C2-DW-16]|uniref:Tetratricopeptide repeat protein n=1 Tax=Donghicola mangrovi TaxID=2729614 RepID=A0A850PYE5_9RHOB|nr:tetratricopeptide repeat protein [Donghicola mangrovi]NVO21853.1 tetratricopeptide repeat protein [Donghicola mangrovi]NVO26558.1 tetratricopeptide repeat protein [Donghicola mangrovi]